MHPGSPTHHTQHHAKEAIIAGLITPHSVLSILALYTNLFRLKLKLALLVSFAFQL
jgi:hypothetical protein